MNISKNNNLNIQNIYKEILRKNNRNKWTVTN